MPMIDLTIPAGALSPQATAALMERLSTTLINWEGAPDNERTRSVTWGFVHEIPSQQFFVGGRALSGRPYYRVDLTVPDKTLLHDNDERKTGLIRTVTEAVLAADEAEPSAESASRVWCLIHEIPDGSWGAFAAQFTMRRILEYIGHTPVARSQVHEVPPPEPTTG
ncbi:MAG: tautomerase family protein [Solirubrobacterales bacterium]